MAETNDPEIPFQHREAMLRAKAAEVLAAMNQPDPGSRPPRRGSSADGRTRITVLGAVFAVIAVVAVVAYGIRFLPKDKTIPDELVGVWHTTDPRYADRPFEITKDILIFHQGGTDSTVHEILEVKRDEGVRETLYTINYDNEEAVYEFAFYYSAVPEGVIRFKNQRHMEWRRGGP
ncbi:MAG: hypothetical protein GTN62_04590 [Gemmatimonadales bacterium]|nr:hypothetical protein [Gemmatimonadales bacterium]NIN10615.1 hypothetical protein [Gemmatimonadales bacterium]NIN49377.1 hypothetical protein [Gemmatimonadales bacterium]NIP06841.1 hypothetical protein [Gemmatimonadales bacterium]NIR01515.1 hypothetical protein [Gemmatimonadales bacterium]